MRKARSDLPSLVRSDGEFRLSNLEIRRKEYDGESSLHWHDYFELEYIQSGEVLYQHNGKSYRLSSGCAYLVTPSDYHKVIANKAVLYNIAFNYAQVSEKIMGKLLACTADMVVELEKNDIWQAEALLDALLKESKHTDELKEEAVTSILTCLLLIFLRKLESVMQESQKISSAVMQAVAYVKLNFKSKISLSQVSSAVHLSTNYLGERFKAEVGQSFSSYLMQTRMNYACNLLRQTGCTVEEAALSSGFSSQAYFSDSFKKQFGYSPAQIRKK